MEFTVNCPFVVRRHFQSISIGNLSLNFSDLGLSDELSRAVADLGYTRPTPIQEKSIPVVLMGRDILGSAQTGTGKTASFTLPMIDILASGRAKARLPRSLILAPTRELAAQVADSFEKFSSYHKLSMALLIGGVSFTEQNAALSKGVDVLIATPGRLLDHFERGKVLLNDVKILVIDEADRMLDMGFIPDIERIFGLTPFTRQTLFFSATMASEIERITNTFLSAPTRIEVARQATASETIEQSVVMFKGSRRDREGSEKRAVLRGLIDAEGAACTCGAVELRGRPSHHRHVPSLCLSWHIYKDAAAQRKRRACASSSRWPRPSFLNRGGRGGGGVGRSGRVLGVVPDGQRVHSLGLGAERQRPAPLREGADGRDEGPETWRQWYHAMSWVRPAPRQVRTAEARA